MTTVVLNTVTRKVEVFSSARDVQARTEIADHKAAVDPHPQYLADADIAEVALSGDAGDLTAGTVPDARMPNWTGYSRASRTALEAANVPAAVDGLRLLGHTAPGDGGGARYKRVASEPGHPGKIQSADGSWWELDEKRLLPNMFGAVGAADDTTTFQNWANSLVAMGKPGRVLPEAYALSGTVDLRGADIEVRFDVGCVFDYSAMTATTGLTRGAAFWFGGEETTPLPALASNALKYDDEITLASAPGVSPGDVCMIWDDDDYSWGSLVATRHPGRPYYKKGEFFRVLSVSGSTITLDRPLFDTYLTSENIQLAKLTMHRVNLTGLPEVIGPALDNADIQNFTAFRGAQLMDFRWENASSHQVPNGIINLFRCYGGVIDKPCGWEDHSNTGARQYGVVLRSCFGVEVLNPNLRTGRHAVTFTGGEEDEEGGANLPNRNCFVRGGMLAGHEYPYDQHGHCEGCGIDGTQVFGGVQIAGKSPIVQNCEIWPNISGANVAGACVHISAEIMDMSITLHNLGLHGWVNAPGSGGYIRMGDTLAPYIGGHLSFRDIRIYHKASSVAGNAIALGMSDDLSDRFSAEFVNITMQHEHASAVENGILLFNMPPASSAVADFLSVSGVLGIAPYLTVRSRSTQVMGVQNRGSTLFGIRVEILSAAVKQVVRVNDNTVLEAGQNSDSDGILVRGSAKGDDIDVYVTGNVTLNAVASGLGAVRVRDVGRIVVTGNIMGDDQGAATTTYYGIYQNALTLSRGSNLKVGTLSADLIQNVDSQPSLQA